MYDPDGAADAGFLDAVVEPDAARRRPPPRRRRAGPSCPRGAYRGPGAHEPGRPARPARRRDRRRPGPSLRRPGVTPESRCPEQRRTGTDRRICGCSPVLALRGSFVLRSSSGSSSWPGPSTCCSGARSSAGWRMVRVAAGPAAGGRRRPDDERDLRADRRASATTTPTSRSRPARSSGSRAARSAQVAHRRPDAELRRPRRGHGGRLNRAPPRHHADRHGRPDRRHVRRDAALRQPTRARPRPPGRHLDRAVPGQGHRPRALNTAVDIIRNRVDGLGIAEPDVQRQGNTIVVDLPGVKDRAKAEELVGQTAELRFRPVQCQTLPWATPIADDHHDGARRDHRRPAPGPTTTARAPTTTARRRRGATSTTISGKARRARTIADRRRSPRSRPAAGDDDPADAAPTTAPARPPTTGARRDDPTTVAPTTTPGQPCTDVLTPCDANVTEAEPARPRAAPVDCPVTRDVVLRARPDDRSPAQRASARPRRATTRTPSSYVTDDHVQERRLRREDRGAATSTSRSRSSSTASCSRRRRSTRASPAATCRSPATFTQGRGAAISRSCCATARCRCSSTRTKQTVESVSPTLGKDQLHGRHRRRPHRPRARRALHAPLLPVARPRRRASGSRSPGMLFFTLISYLSTTRRASR